MLQVSTFLHTHSTESCKLNQKAQDITNLLEDVYFKSNYNETSLVTPLLTHTVSIKEKSTIDILYL